MGGASSSRIVPWPWASAITAFVAVSRLTTNVSLGSTVASPFTVTATVRRSAPGAKVSVPLVGP